MSTSTTHAPLTVHDVLVLAEIVQAASGGERVVFAEDGKQSLGTARHLVTDPEGMGFLKYGDDVRDAYLRVTMVDGWDRFELVSDLMKAIHETFFVHDWMA